MACSVGREIHKVNPHGAKVQADQTPGGAERMPDVLFPIGGWRSRWERTSASTCKLAHGPKVRVPRARKSDVGTATTRGHEADGEPCPFRRIRGLNEARARWRRKKRALGTSSLCITLKKSPRAKALDVVASSPLACTSLSFQSSCVAAPCKVRRCQEDWTCCRILLLGRFAFSCQTICLKKSLTGAKMIDDVLGGGVMRGTALETLCRPNSICLAASGVD